MASLTGAISEREFLMYDKNDDFDVGREIQRSWLLRGEYDKFYEAQGLGYAFSGIVFLVCVVLGTLLKTLGIW